MAVCWKLNFLPILFVFAIALLLGCAQQKTNEVCADGKSICSVNETGNTQLLEEQPNATSDDQNTSSLGLSPTNQSNASILGGGADINTTTDAPVYKTNETPLAVSIVSFSTDKTNYSSNEKIVFSVVVNSSVAVENASINIFGIKPHQYAYVNDTKIAALESGINTLNFTETAPSCTAGCGGVYPGPYDANVQIFVRDVLVANATMTITLVGEPGAAKASDFI